MGGGPPHGRAEGLSDPAEFVRANTRLRPVPHAPEIALHVADEAVPLWSKTEEELERDDLPPPFWAFAWAGGQALARYLMDAPETVRGRRVLDVGSGSGLVAIAAMKAGASSVLAVDIDPFALAAIEANAAANGVAISTSGEDPIGRSFPKAEIVTVGDLFYERDLAQRLLAWLDGFAARGVPVLIGDPGRSYLPKDRLAPLADYAVPVTRELEDSDIKRTTVWRLRSQEI
ncbi:class I SAM-dependent methyltransferase [Hansschlegelia quercus]|uniref:Methyltransferase n=1 Tax=Hansschlegelia quercus TaxID=2528245 RepID=A0A4Q9GQ74_9HYPH|nr:methyltransferase [Hansschlegelia quercus]TBN53807.1 methyltransferase [Hansschlegelia quercus]